MKNYVVDLGDHVYVNTWKDKFENCEELPNNIKRSIKVNIGFAASFNENGDLEFVEKKKSTFVLVPSHEN